MVDQGFVLIQVRRPIGEKCNARGQLSNRKLLRCNVRRRLLGGKKLDDGVPVVRAARATHFMKLRVQQLLQPLTTAASPRMMELDFERLEFKKEGGHEGFVLRGLTLEARRGRRPSPLGRLVIPHCDLSPLPATELNRAAIAAMPLYTNQEDNPISMRKMLQKA